MGTRVFGYWMPPLSPEVGLGRLRQLLSERNRKHPLSTEVGHGRLRQLLSERNRKHPISPEVGHGRLRQLLSERNRKHPISRGMTPSASLIAGRVLSEIRGEPALRRCQRRLDDGPAFAEADAGEASSLAV